MQLAYHVKHNNQWQHVITAPIDAEQTWTKEDRWAFNFMIEKGFYNITQGSTMWQLIND